MWSILDTVSGVGFSEENPITSNKKQKPAPSNASENEEWVGLVLPCHQPNPSINQVATGVTPADIESLETKLHTSYEYQLLHYQEEIATLQDQLASDKANYHDRGHLDLQKASLKKENYSLAKENSTILAKVVKEKQQDQKEVLALASNQARSSSHTFLLI
jgi:hypothetical protein